MIQNFVIESHELLIFCSGASFRQLLAPHSNIQSTIAEAPSSQLLLPVPSSIYPQADVPCAAWKLNFVSSMFFPSYTKHVQMRLVCSEVRGQSCQVLESKFEIPPLAIYVGNGLDWCWCLHSTWMHFWNARQLAKLAVWVPIRIRIPVSIPIPRSASGSESSVSWEIPPKRAT